MKHEHLDDTNGAHKDPRDRAIDDALGLALRAEDPGAAFTQRVLARAREERAAKERPAEEWQWTRTEVSPSMRSEVSVPAPTEVSAPAARARAHRFTATRKLIAAIAASLTLAAAGTQWMQHRRYVAEGERARAQVLAALRLTNQKLNIVHEKITEREQAR
jgi:hypothetical protein